MTHAQLITTVLTVSVLAALSAADPPAVTLIRQSDASSQTLKAFLGRYVILEFLPKEPTTQVTQGIEERFAAARSLAGTQVICITPDAADAEALRSTLDSGRSLAMVDAEGALAHEFGLPDSSPPTATIILGPDGRERFRHVPTALGAGLSSADLIRRFDESTGATARAHYNLPAGMPLAIEGYDPVAYFTQSRAVKGIPSFTARYEGVVYRFSSAAHRDLFIEAPEKYLPTYGGWCASAMGAKGTKVEIDPTNFKVSRGRPFLFYKSFFADALNDWNKHEREWEPAADANWKKVADEDPVHPAN